MGIFRWRRFKSMPESITGKTKTTARNLPAGLREPVNGGLPPVAALRQGILWLFFIVAGLRQAVIWSFFPPATLRQAVNCR